MLKVLKNQLSYSHVSGSHNTGKCPKFSKNVISPEINVSPIFPVKGKTNRMKKASNPLPPKRTDSIPVSMILQQKGP